MIRHTILALAICFFSCSDEHVVTSRQNTVHMAGFLGTSDGLTVASYWNNVAYTPLTGDTNYSQVSSLYVDAGSVWIGGLSWTEGSPIKTAHWHDGQKTVIEGAFGSPLIAAQGNNLVGVWEEPPTGWRLHKSSSSQPILDTALNVWPIALTLRGDDVYIVGCSSGLDNKQHAQYWKNEKLIFKEEAFSNAMSVFIHKNDIYMAGYVQLGSTHLGACYWKNGERVDLTDGTDNAITKGIFVTDDHVYVSGTINNQAVYWIDGKPIALTTNAVSAMANCISVSGKDIHVAGYENEYPAYWKNDVRQNIANQETPGQIRFMVVENR